MDPIGTESLESSIKVEVKEEPEYIYVDESVCRVKLEESEDDLMLPKEEETERVVADVGLSGSQPTIHQLQPSRTRGRRRRILQMRKPKSNNIGTTVMILPRPQIQVPNLNITRAPLPISHLQPTVQCPPKQIPEPVAEQQSSGIQSLSLKTTSMSQVTANTTGTGRKILPRPHIPAPLVHPQHQTVPLQQLQSVSTSTSPQSIPLNQIHSISPGNNCNIIPIHQLQSAMPNSNHTTLPVPQLKSAATGQSKKAIAISPQKASIPTIVKKPIPVPQLKSALPVSCARVSSAPHLQSTPSDCSKKIGHLQQKQSSSSGHGRKLLLWPKQPSIRPPSGVIIHPQQQSVSLQHLQTLTPASMQQTVPLQQMQSIPTSSPQQAMPIHQLQHICPVSTPQNIPVQQIQTLNPVNTQQSMALHSLQNTPSVTAQQSLSLQTLQAIPSRSSHQPMPVQHLQTMPSGNSHQTMPLQQIHTLASENSQQTLSVQQVQSIPSGSSQGIPVQQVQTIPPGNSQQSMPIQHLQTLTNVNQQNVPLQNLQTIASGNSQQGMPMQHFQTVTSVSSHQNMPLQNLQTMASGSSHQTMSVQQFQTVSSGNSHQIMPMPIQQLQAIPSVSTCQVTPIQHVQSISPASKHQAVPLQQLHTIAPASQQQNIPLQQLSSITSASTQQIMPLQQYSNNHSSLPLHQIQTLPHANTQQTIPLQQLTSVNPSIAQHTVNTSIAQHAGNPSIAQHAVNPSIAQHALPLQQLHQVPQPNGHQALPVQQLQSVNQGNAQTNHPLQQLQTSLPSGTHQTHIQYFQSNTSSPTQNVPLQQQQQSISCNGSNQSIQFQSPTSVQNQSTMPLPQPADAHQVASLHQMHCVSPSKSQLKMPIQPMNYNQFTKNRLKRLRQHPVPPSCSTFKNRPILKVGSVTSYAVEKNIRLHEKKLFISEPNDKTVPVVPLQATTPGQGRIILPRPPLPSTSGSANIQTDILENLQSITSATYCKILPKQDLQSGTHYRTIVIPPMKSSVDVLGQNVMSIPELQSTTSSLTHKSVVIQQPLEATITVADKKSVTVQVPLSSASVGSFIPSCQQKSDSSESSVNTETDTQLLEELDIPTKLQHQSTCSKTEAVHDEEIITDAQCVEGITEDQGVEGIKDVQCIEGVTDDQCVEGVTDDQCVEGITEARCVEGITDNQCVESVADDQCVEGTKEAQCVEEITDVQCVEDVANTRCIEDITDARCVDGITDVHCESLPPSEFESPNLESSGVFSPAPEQDLVPSDTGSEYASSPLEDVAATDDCGETVSDSPLEVVTSGNNAVSQHPVQQSATLGTRNEHFDGTPQNYDKAMMNVAPQPQIHLSLPSASNEPTGISKEHDHVSHFENRSLPASPENYSPDCLPSVTEHIRTDITHQTIQGNQLSCSTISPSDYHYPQNYVSLEERDDSFVIHEEQEGNMIVDESECVIQNEHKDLIVASHSVADEQQYDSSDTATDFVPVIQQHCQSSGISNEFSSTHPQHFNSTTAIQVTSHPQPLHTTGITSESISTHSHPYAKPCTSGKSQAAPQKGYTLLEPSNVDDLAQPVSSPVFYSNVNAPRNCTSVAELEREHQIEYTVSNTLGSTVSGHELQYPIPCIINPALSFNHTQERISITENLSSHQEKYSSTHANLPLPVTPLQVSSSNNNNIPFQNITSPTFSTTCNYIPTPALQHSISGTSNSSYWINSHAHHPKVMEELNFTHLEDGNNGDVEETLDIPVSHHLQDTLQVPPNEYSNQEGPVEEVNCRENVLGQECSEMCLQPGGDHHSLSYLKKHFIKKRRRELMELCKLKVTVISQKQTIRTLWKKLRFERRKNSKLQEKIKSRGSVASRVDLCTYQNSKMNGVEKNLELNAKKDTIRFNKKRGVCSDSSSVNNKKQCEEKTQGIFRQIINIDSENIGDSMKSLHLAPKKNISSCASESELQCLIQEFMMLDDVSQLSKKTVTLSGKTNPIRYRLHYLSVLHKRFIADCCKSCSFQTFCKYIPCNVLKCKADELDSCLCMTCQNPELKIESMVKRRYLSMNTNIEKIIEDEEVYESFLINLKSLKSQHALLTYTTWSVAIPGNGPPIPHKRTLTRSLSEVSSLLENELHSLKDHIKRTYKQYEAAYQAKCEAASSSFHAVIQTGWSPLIILQSTNKIGVPEPKAVISLQCGYMWSEMDSTGFVGLSDSKDRTAAAVCASLEKVLKRVIKDEMESLTFIVDPQTHISGIRECARRHGIEVKCIFLEPGHGHGVAEAIGNSITQLICDTINANGSSAIGTARDVFNLISSHSSNLVYFYTADDIRRQRELLNLESFSKTGNKFIKPKILVPLQASNI